MELFRTIFRRQADVSKKAVAFVDYEHWYYSYHNLYGIKPGISAWRKKLETQFELLDILVFGDFSQPIINQELCKIREATNTIIETAHPGFKKDMTDFIMLDYLYQMAAENRDIGTYILFTGDGHFQPVTKYLTQKKKKEAVVYGVRGAFSSQLKASASKCIEYPYQEELVPGYYDIIIRHFDYISNKNINPTFMKTVEVIAERNQIEEDVVRSILQEMLDKGYVYQEETPVSFNRKIRIVRANWELLIKDGLWDPDKEDEA